MSPPPVVRTFKLFRSLRRESASIESVGHNAGGEDGHSNAHFKVLNSRRKRALGHMSPGRLSNKLTVIIVF